METFKESLLILLFEMLGTMLLTGLWCACFFAADLCGLLCGFFILLIFSARISGSHFNPAITLAFMFRKDTGRFSRLLGLLYIAAQYAGAILGAIVTYNLFQAHGGDADQPLKVLYHYSGDVDCGWNDGEYKCDTDKFLLLVQAIIQEIVNSMILTFLYLTQTEEKTKISGDPAITTLIIAATYTGLVGYSILSAVFTGSPFNPAAAFGIAVAQLFQGHIDDTNQIYVFFIFSYAGSILATLLFEFIYKKAMMS